MSEKSDDIAVLLGGYRAIRSMLQDVEIILMPDDSGIPDQGLQIKFRQRHYRDPNVVQIVPAEDLYKVRFCRTWGRRVFAQNVLHRVQGEDLATVFEHFTGYNLLWPNMRGYRPYEQVK